MQSAAQPCDLTDIKADDDDEREETFDAESERQDREDRQHRLRFQQQLGTPVHPADFAPPEPPEKEDEEEAVAGHFAEQEQPEYDPARN